MARKAIGDLAGRAAVSLQLRVRDAADVVRGQRPELVPPRRLQRLVGDSNFTQAGEELARLLTDHGVLTPGARVLDVGCGAGRVAHVLTRTLRPPGSYDGFDVMQPAITWCRRRYRDLPVPFRFVHADIHNAVYNPTGAARAAHFTFPYSDGAFDLVLATSVFTHLLADAAERYLDEATRVLAPGGHLFTTWFLLRAEDDRSEAARFRFERTDGPAAVADPTTPEAAVAYDTDWVRTHLERRGMPLREEPLRGSWAGTSGATFQDILIARRT